MVKNKQNNNKFKNRRVGNKDVLDKPVSYVNIFILLTYGFITVLTPNLRAIDSNGPKFLALAIFNLMVWGYFIYREYNNNSLSTFNTFFKTKIGLAYSVLILLSLLSFTKSINVIESVVQFSKLFTTFTATWIISIILLKDKRIIKYLAIGLTGLLVFDSLRVFYETYQYIQGDIESIKLIKAGYSNKNILAAALFVKFPFALWLLTFEKGRLKYIGLIAIFLTAIAVLFMSTRAFYLGLIILSVIYGIFLAIRFFQTKNKGYVATVVMYFSSLLIAFLIFSAVQRNFYPEEKSSYNKSFTGRLATITVNEDKNARLKFWGWTVDLIKENPLLGVGHGNWKIVILEKENQMKPKFSYMIVVHNDFLEISAETGLLGGLFFISIFVLIFYSFIRSVIRKEPNDYLKYYFLSAFGLLAYSFDAFFNFPHDRPQIQSLFALYVGLGIALSYARSNKEKERSKTEPMKLRVGQNKKWLWVLPTFILLSTVVAGYVLVLNFESLKLQRIGRDEKISGQTKTPAKYFLNHYYQIPNLAVTGDPMNTLIANMLIQEEQYEQALSLLYSENPSPFDSRHEFYLSQSHFKLNQLDSTLYYIQQAYQLKPLYFVYSQNYANILETMNRDAKAISVFDNFLINTKDEKKAWKFNAELNFKAGDKKKAALLMDSAFHYFPKDTTIVRLRDYYATKYLMPNYEDAVNFYNAKKYSEAIVYFELSEAGYYELGGYERFPDFLNSWARSLLELNEFEQAKTIFKKVVEEDKKNYYALMNLGNIAFHNEKNYKEAISYFTKCIEANSPDYYLSYKNLGTLYLIQEQPDRAIENYENALKHESSKEIIGNLHLLWKSKGNEDKAAYYKTLWENYGQKRKPPDERRLSL
ncbi:MAG: hypothetical protein DRI89_05100 [Bacteroidetes bacterium]|nr:MAG: hypothetical protein DRI89_05100 [Bacteroidota bacterium]